MTVNRAFALAALANFFSIITTTMPWGDVSPQSIAVTANPKVKPSDVNWRANFEAACAASKESGKPVLLFQ